MTRTGASARPTGALASTAPATSAKRNGAIIAIAVVIAGDDVCGPPPVQRRRAYMFDGDPRENLADRAAEAAGSTLWTIVAHPAEDRRGLPLPMETVAQTATVVGDDNGSRDRLAMDHKNPPIPRRRPCPDRLVGETHNNGAIPRVCATATMRPPTATSRTPPGPLSRSATATCIPTPPTRSGRARSTPRGRRRRRRRPSRASVTIAWREPSLEG